MDVYIQVILVCVYVKSLFGVAKWIRSRPLNCISLQTVA